MGGNRISTDTPERNQDDEWYARRRALGAVCDAYVGFQAPKDTL